VASPVRPTDTPSDRLAKLLPAEVTGLYITVSGLCAAAHAGNTDTILFYSTIAIAIIGMLYLYLQRGVVNFIHLAVYLVSFFLWVLTLQADNIDIKYYGEKGTFPLVISIMTVLWSFLLPLVVSSEILSSKVENPPASKGLA
jgi:hypothetical protein